MRRYSWKEFGNQQFPLSDSVQHPLQAFYDSGAILIHHSIDGASPADGPVTALTNHGGAGDVFNATVTGAAIPLSGRFLQMTSNGGMPVLGAPANLVGIRLMWVMQISAYTNGTRLFGGAASSPYGFDIRLNWNTSGAIPQLWSNSTGTATSVNVGARTAWPNTAVLIEIELGPSLANGWLNGISLGSTAHPWTQFLIENLGKGQTAGMVPMEGLLGDILGVATGLPDTTAAVLAVRQYLNDRFSLGLVA